MRLEYVSDRALLIREGNPTVIVWTRPLSA